MPSSIIKSYDAGKTWQPIIEGIKLDWETRVQSLAINPKKSNVLYAGTGGFYGGDFYKSHDGGLLWNKTPSDSLLDGVFCIAINPVDTNIVYVGTAFYGAVWMQEKHGFVLYQEKQDILLQTYLYKTLKIIALFILE